MSEKLPQELSCKDFVDIIQLILDGEATKQQEKSFLTHVDNCHPCAKHFNLDKQVIALIRERLQQDCSKTHIPEGLTENIKTQIDQMMVS